MEFWLLHKFFFPVAHDDYESKNYRYVGKKGDVADKTEGFKPTYRNQNDAANYYVSILVIAIVLLGFKANHLIELVSYEYKIGNAETKLTHHHVKVNKSFSIGSKHSVPQLRIRRNMTSNLLLTKYL